MKLTIRNTSVTKEDIDFLYNLYVNAVIELAKVKDIVLVGIFERTPSNPKLDTNNPYVKGEWLTELGESVLKNGTHWVYIVRHRKFLAGNHRIMSLRKLAEAGKIPRDHKVLAIDVTNSTFGKGLPIKTLKAKELDEMKEHGISTERRSCTNYRSWIEAVLRIPNIFKEVFYEYKCITGHEYKTLLVINNIDELNRRVKNYGRRIYV